MNNRALNDNFGIELETPAPASESATADTTLLATHQRRFLYEHQTCAMCDSVLEIMHDINKKELKVKEQANCPSCGIRVRSSHHLMH